MVKDAETKMTRAEAEVTRLTAMVNTVDDKVTQHREMEEFRGGKTNECKQNPSRSHHAITCTPQTRLNNACTVIPVYAVRFIHLLECQPQLAS